MPTLLNRALYDATYKATKDMLKFNWWCPGFVPFLKMIDLPEGQAIYRYSSAKDSDGGYWGNRKIWSALENDRGNRWTGFAMGGLGGRVGLYTTLEAEREKDTLFSELFHYMPTDTNTKIKSVKYYKFPGRDSPSDQLVATVRQSAAKLHFMFTYTLTEKKRILDLRLPATPNDETFFVANVFQLAQSLSPNAFLPGRNCIDLYMDPSDASFCRAIGNAVLEEVFVDGFMVTSTRNTQSTSVIFKGPVGAQFEFLKFNGRSSFFLEAHDKFTVMAETVADMEYNDEHWDGPTYSQRMYRHAMATAHAFALRVRAAIGA